MRLNLDIRSALLLAGTLSLLDPLSAAATKPALPDSSDQPTAETFEVNPVRGMFTAPIRIILSGNDSTNIFFTTNGARPSLATGQRWTGSLQVRSTTTLRLARIPQGGAAGAVETHTYLFPKNVADQAGTGLPSHWGFTNGEPVLAYYRTEPEITKNPRYRDLLEPALRALPSISIVMDVADLFAEPRGIYAHPQESSAAWERPASVEWIQSDGQAGFQVDCGVRIQGGWNRRPEESPKHSFRLVFNKRFGQPRLSYPLFGPGVTDFETVILRAGCNNTWLHWSGEERRRGDYIRDQWMRDTLQAMGHASARGRFVHLYLNGTYWGLYNLCERPSAPFMAAHFGGAPKQFDVRNGDHLLEGSGAAWNDLLQLANQGVTEDSAYAAVQRLLDIPQFIDYMIANLYGANADWDRSSNWYAARRRKPPGQFQFFVWDGERTLESVDASALNVDDDQSPTRLFQRLRQNAQFQHEFARRARQHLLEGGCLGPAAAAARWQRLAGEIDLAIVAESARWGGYRQHFHRYKTGPFEVYARDDHWRPEIERVLHEFFPQRSSRLLEQFHAAGLE